MDVEPSGGPDNTAADPDALLTIIAGELEDARQTGRLLIERLDEQTQTIVGLQDKALQLQDYIAFRENEIEKLSEQLRVVQRELDRTKRESAAKVNVCRTNLCRLFHLLMTHLHSFSGCVQVRYVLRTWHEKLWNWDQCSTQDHVRNVVQSIRVEVECPVCLGADKVTHWYVSV